MMAIAMRINAKSDKTKFERILAICSRIPVLLSSQNLVVLCHKLSSESRRVALFHSSRNSSIWPLAEAIREALQILQGKLSNDTFATSYVTSFDKTLVISDGQACISYVELALQLLKISRISLEFSEQ